MYSFKEPIKLSDIYDLRDNGKIWTFSLRRSQTANVMFSISDGEFEELLNLYLKLNPIYQEPKQIREPYPFFEPNLEERLTIHPVSYQLKYEYTVMSALLFAFSKNKFTSIFGAYSDYLAYVPTSFEREIDIVLIFNHPHDAKRIIAYNIIEVKRDRFDEAGLKQLLQYEEWFLKKKVNGDSSMLRATATAGSFDEPVIEYLRKRKEYEGKYITLLKYENGKDGLLLSKVEY